MSKRILAYSPGPWHIWERDGEIEILTPENCTVCLIPVEVDDLSKEDARLVAAAPHECTRR